ncbi:MAG: hypothetical protein ACRBFS_24835, partial [Aureispira sp.]
MPCLIVLLNFPTRDIPNFLDCLKHLPNANLQEEDIEMACQIEFDLNGVFTVPNCKVWVLYGIKIK